MIRLGILLRLALAAATLLGLSVLTWTTLADLRRPDLSGPDALGDGLAAGAAWALQGCLVWLCLIVVTVVVEAGAPPDAAAPWSDRLGCPPTLRRLVLIGCGLTVLVGAGPAYAAEAPPDPSSAVDLTGLALPDRVATPEAPGVPAPAVPTPAAPAPSTSTPSTSAPAAPTPSTSTGSAPTPAEQRSRPASSVEAAAPTPARARPAPAGDDVVVRSGDTLWALARHHLPPGASDAAIAAAVHRWHDANRSALADPDLIHPGQHLSVPAGSQTEENR